MHNKLRNVLFCCLSDKKIVNIISIFIYIYVVLCKIATKTRTLDENAKPLHDSYIILQRGGDVSIVSFTCT